MVKKVFTQMTATQIVSAVTVTVCLLIDSIVIGRLLGVDAMSAYGLASPVIIIFNALGTMTSVGVQVMIGKSMGRGDLKECRACFSTSIAMSLAMAAVWILFIFAAARPLCILLGAGKNEILLKMTSEYLRGYIIGAPFFFLSQIMTPFLQSMGKRRLTLITVAVMTVTDISFDLISVYVFNAGMTGIGLASSLSYLTSVLAGISYFRHKDCPFRFEREGVQIKTAAEIAHGGSPVVVNQGFFMIRAYAINQILLAVSGTVAVAAFSVISTIGNIMFSIGLGAGSISLMLASIFHSEEDRTSIYELIRVMLSYSLKLIAAVVAAVIAAAPWLIKLFLGSDPSVLEIAVPGLRIYSLSLICCVITTVFKNYYQGTGHMKLTNSIAFFDNVGILLPVTWLFSVLMGLTGVWVGILIAQIGTVLMISAVAWFRYGRISFTAEAYSMLGPDFGADPSDVFEFSVTDMNSAILASEKINEFCISKDLGNRLSMLVSLCVEEIVVNIIEHGFTNDDDPHSADVRLVVDESKCKIRIRDNCIGFDPVSYLELHQTTNPTDHIGIRIVTAMVSEINYINSLGLNNLYMSLDRVGDRA